MTQEKHGSAGIVEVGFEINNNKSDCCTRIRKFGVQQSLLFMS